jgi:predicted transcriptional regulator
LEERSEDAGKTIARDVEEVLQHEKENLKAEDVEKLNEILEETEDLRSETKE